MRRVCSFLAASLLALVGCGESRVPLSGVWSTERNGAILQVTLTERGDSLSGIGSADVGEDHDGRAVTASGFRVGDTVALTLTWATGGSSSFQGLAAGDSIVGMYDGDAPMTLRRKR